MEKLAMADIARLRDRSFVDRYSCEVISFGGDNGMCLEADRGVFTTYRAHIFGRNLELRFTVPLRGVPSRTRVSPNGKIAATTVFITGHSYPSADFSTMTLLIDTNPGKSLVNLEDFTVTKDGQPYGAQDFNFWGVTFTPDSTGFYCTLSSNRRHYLISANLGDHSASVIYENVECPSLSPDGKPIAYKKRYVAEGRVLWRLQILDLPTMTETPLAEKRTVDDQLEWLDNAHVLYALPKDGAASSASTDVWTASAGGDNPPRLFIADAALTDLVN
jgi:hypothetical protein